MKERGFSLSHSRCVFVLILGRLSPSIPSLSQNPKKSWKKKKEFVFPSSCCCENSREEKNNLEFFLFFPFSNTINNNFTTNPNEMRV